MAPANTLLRVIEPSQHSPCAARLVPTAIHALSSWRGRAAG